MPSLTSRGGACVAVAVCAVFAMQAESAAQSRAAAPRADQLRADLRGGDYRRARQAAWRLGQDAALAEAAVDDLAKALASDDLEVAWYASEALRGAGPQAAKAAPALIAVLREENPENLDPTLGQLAARALGQILRGSQDQTASAALRATLNSKYEMLRFEAAQALARIEGSPDGAASLEAALQNGSRDLAYITARTWRENAQPDANPKSLLSALGHADEDVRRAAIEALCKSGPSFAGPLAAAIQQGQVNPVTGAEALGQVGKALRQGNGFDPAASKVAIEQQLIPALRRLLAAGDDAGCRAAGLALALIGRDGVPTLVTGLVYREPKVRAASALGIERLKESEIALPADETARGVHEKLALALAHPEPAVQRAGWRLFSALATPEEVAKRRPAFHAALHGNDPLVRQFAAKALARRSASRAAPKSGE